MHGKTQKKEKTRKSKRLKGPESGMVRHSMKRKNRMKINREAEQRKKTSKRTHTHTERERERERERKKKGLTRRFRAAMQLTKMCSIEKQLSVSNLKLSFERRVPTINDVATYNIYRRKTFFSKSNFFKRHNLLEPRAVLIFIEGSECWI